jgi:hypothetical protein
MKKRAEKFCKTQSFKYCNEKNLISYSRYPYSTIKLEDILINIIPINVHNIRYIQSFQTDVNDFIYELSGTVGLWFRLSPVSLFDIMSSQI